MNTEKSPSLAATSPASALPQVKEKDPDSWSELAKTAVIALLLAVLIRSFLYEPFNIPSGSMLPTLQIGDYLFVDKRTYGYSRYSFPFGVIPIEGRIWTGGETPARGDVVVFKLPSDNRTDYIKRIVGLPGDRIQVTNGRLLINGKIVPRDPVGVTRLQNGYGQTITLTEYIETLPGGAKHRIYEESDTAPLDNTPVFRVPTGHYFMMGDNRDNSRDSRVMDLVGFVPVGHMVGRAQVIFFSHDGSAAWWEFWRWPFALRTERFFSIIPAGLS